MIFDWSIKKFCQYPSEKINDRMRNQQNRTKLFEILIKTL